MRALGLRLSSALLLTVLLAFAGYAQRYTDATMTGPWLLIAMEDWLPSHLYMWFDGAGTLVDLGSFDDGSTPDGSYSVAPNGTISGVFHEPGDTGIIGGSLDSDSTATIDIIMGTDTMAALPLIRVNDMSLLAGTWGGAFMMDSGGAVLNVSFTIDTNGAIVSAIGLAGPVAGSFFAQSGYFAAHMTTGESTGWEQAMLSGSLDGDTLTGRVNTDCPEASCTGSLRLVRAPQAVFPHQAKHRSHGMELRLRQETGRMLWAEVTARAPAQVSIAVRTLSGETVVAVNDVQLAWGKHQVPLGQVPLAAGVYQCEVGARKGLLANRLFSVCR